MSSEKDPKNTLNPEESINQDSFRQTLFGRLISEAAYSITYGFMLGVTGVLVSRHMFPKNSNHAKPHLKRV